MFGKHSQIVVSRTFTACAYLIRVSSWRRFFDGFRVDDYVRARHVLEPENGILGSLSRLTYLVVRIPAYMRKVRYPRATSNLRKLPAGVAVDHRVDGAKLLFSNYLRYPL